MSRTVYVGRIPYDYTEEQVGEVMRSVGPVSAIRLMFDKDSGKSKGFAFVEYRDKESAASAVRNLNNYQVGNQKLKVDLSDDNGPKGGHGGGHGGGHQPSNEPEDPRQQIANLVSSMSQQDKTGFLADFKVFARLHPAEANQLLESNGQLAYALVQTMIDSGKITTRAADKLIQKEETPEPEAEPEAKVKAEPRAAPKAKAKPAAKDPSPAPDSASPSPAPTAAPAASALPAPSSTPEPKPVDDNQRQMIVQVMAFSPEQIEMLPQAQRHAVLELRGKVERGEFLL